MAKTGKTMDQLKENYITSLQAEGKAENTVKTYMQATEQFIEQINSVNNITQESVNKFLSHYSARTQTQSLKKNALTKFLNYLKDENVLKKNIRMKVSNPARVEPEFLTREEQKRLEEVLKYDSRHFEDYVLFCFMLYAGLRVNEVLNLRIADVLGESIIIRKSKTGSGRVLFKKSLKELVKDYIVKRRSREDTASGSEDFLFVSQQRRPYHQTAVNKKLEKYLKLAKIKKSISPHGLRHTFAARLRETGSDLEIIRRALRHRFIQSTLIYSHINKEEEKAALERL